MTALFDDSAPGAMVIKSSFGGGWIVPLTPRGSEVLAEYFDAEPAPIPWHNNDGPALGYIVEPQDAADVAAYLQSENLKWIVA